MISIDLYILITQLLPPAMYYDWYSDYIKSAAKPLNDLYTSFYSFFDSVKYRLTFNGQVIYMEHVLNDQFDNINRGIYITDSNLVDSTFIFTHAEGNEPFYIGMNSESLTPNYLFTNQEYVDDVDFVVNVPSTVTFNIDELKYLVNSYRIAPMRWEINIV